MGRQTARAENRLGLEPIGNDFSKDGFVMTVCDQKGIVIASRSHCLTMTPLGGRSTSTDVLTMELILLREMSIGADLIVRATSAELLNYRRCITVQVLWCDDAAMRLVCPFDVLQHALADRQELSQPQLPFR
jgi:hypothetical protein